MIGSHALKRPMDLLLAGITVIGLAPLLAVVAATIKWVDPGPVLFRQKRVGRDGEAFDILKFRSMPVNTGDLPSDQIHVVRLTWIGSLIRRTNIDELPQLINILKGEMSIVGPRPSLPSQISLVDLRRANGALTCRPGLTGLAQIHSFDGMTVEQKAALDAEYARCASLWMDVKIILGTFSYLLHPPPKY